MKTERKKMHGPIPPLGTQQRMQSDVLHLHWRYTPPVLPTNTNTNQLLNARDFYYTFVRTAIDANELPKLIPTTGANEFDNWMGVSAAPLGRFLSAIVVYVGIGEGRQRYVLWLCVFITNIFEYYVIQCISIAKNRVIYLILAL